MILISCSRCTAGLLAILAKSIAIAIAIAIPGGNKKFELMLTRRAKAYSSSGSVV